MQAEQSLHEARLDDALKQLQDQVRKDPSNPKYRIFLFQLLAVLGNWERALTQLNVAADMDDANLAMAQTYREALRCEALRAEIFAGKRSPLIFGEPQQWEALVMEALRLTAQGEHARAQEVRSEAFGKAPATRGRIDGREFAWVADADPRTGPILEAIINGQYYWIPFQNIQAIQMEAPEDLRDSVWMPAFFTWINGGEAAGLIPTRYPGSEQSDDPLIRLARKTEWQAVEGDLYLGLGQRMLATDEDEYPLMDMREIRLDVQPPSAEEGGA